MARLGLEWHAAPRARRRLAHDCHGYTGADLRALCREAVLHAVNAMAAQGQLSEPGQLGAGRPQQLQPVTAANFAAARQQVGPSMARGAALELDPIR